MDDSTAEGGGDVRPIIDRGQNVDPRRLPLLRPSSVHDAVQRRFEKDRRIEELDFSSVAAATAAGGGGEEEEEEGEEEEDVPPPTVGRGGRHLLQRSPYSFDET